MTISVEARGMEFSFPDGTSSAQIGQAVDEYFRNQDPDTVERWTQDKFDNSLTGKAWEALTGNNRMTPTMEKLDNVTAAPELNGAGDMAQKWRTALSQLFASDKTQMEQIAKMGGTFSQDEKGNIVVHLPSGDYALNKPGLSTQDALSLGANLITQAPALATTGGAPSLVAGGANNLAQQIITDEITGQPINWAEVGFSSLGNALPEFLHIGGAAGMDALRASQKAAENGAADALKYADDAEAQRIMSELSPESVARMMLNQGEASELAIHQAAEQSGHSIEGLTRAVNAMRAENAQAMTDATKSALRGDLEKLASQAGTNEERRAIAEKMGLNPDMIPASWLSDNRQFVEFYQAMKQMPGSVLSPVEAEAIKALSGKADDFIEKWGGTTDLSQLDEEARQAFQGTLDDLQAQSDMAYETIQAKIPPSVRMIPSETLNAVETELKALGGDPKNLSAVERSILDKLAPIKQDGGKMSSPTLYLVNSVRKDIGAALSKQGVYRGADEAKLAYYYGKLTEDLDRRYDAMELGDEMRTAREGYAKVKEMQKATMDLFGRDIANSILPRLKDATASATQGNASKIKKFMKSLPVEQRPTVAASALHFLFNAGARGGDRALAIPGFVKGYEGLLRNPGAKEALLGVLPFEARKELQDFYTFAKAANDAIQAVPKTGVVGTIAKEFEAADTLAERILTGEVVPGAGTVDLVLSHIPVVSNAYSGVKGLAKAGAKEAAGGAPKTRMKAGAELLASPEFADAVKSYASRKVTSEVAIEQANAALRKSKKYQEWIKTLAPWEQRLAQSVPPLKLFAYWAALGHGEPTEQN